MTDLPSGDQSGIVGRSAAFVPIVIVDVCVPALPLQSVNTLVGAVPRPSDVRYCVWSGENVLNPGGCPVPRPAYAVPIGFFVVMSMSDPVTSLYSSSESSSSE